MSMKFAFTAVALAVLPQVVFAQAPNTDSKIDCARNSSDPACTETQTRGTVSGPDKSTVSPGPGAAKDVGGAGKASGVTPQGNPATSGGGPRSSQ